MRERGQATVEYAGIGLVVLAPAAGRRHRRPGAARATDGRRRLPRPGAAGRAADRPRARRRRGAGRLPHLPLAVERDRWAASAARPRHARGGLTVRDHLRHRVRCLRHGHLLHRFRRPGRRRAPGRHAVPAMRQPANHARSTATRATDDLRDAGAAQGTGRLPRLSPPWPSAARITRPPPGHA